MRSERAVCVLLCCSVLRASRGATRTCHNRRRETFAARRPRRRPAAARRRQQQHSRRRRSASPAPRNHPYLPAAARRPSEAARRRRPQPERPKRPPLRQRESRHSGGGGRHIKIKKAMRRRRRESVCLRSVPDLFVRANVRRVRLERMSISCVWTSHERPVRFRPSIGETFNRPRDSATWNERTNIADTCTACKSAGGGGAVGGYLFCGRNFVGARNDAVRCDFDAVNFESACHPPPSSTR